MESTIPTLTIGPLTISPDLFSQGYPEGGGPCTCTSTCCEGGVYADVAERDRILRHAEMISRHMDETQNADPSAWFDPAEEPDPDFPSGRCVGTSVINAKCALLDRAGRCSLQVAATAAGMHRWELKPLYCILYPIEVTDNLVGFDPLLQGEQACCTVTNRFQLPVFEACQDELVRLLGEDGFRQLQSHYQTYYKPLLEQRRQ